MKLLTIALITGLVPAALCAQDNPFNATPAQKALIAKIPTDSAATARDIFNELDKDADKMVPAFIATLTTHKSDADTTARYALGGLVWTIGHSGTDEQKQELAKLLADNIKNADGVEPKSFVIEQLQYMGQDSVAKTLYPLMTDEDLGPRAIRTLAALKPDGLIVQTLSKLSDSNTTEVQSGLLLTVARLAPSNAAVKVAPYVKAENSDVRESALDALAAIGDPASQAALKEAADKSDTFHDLLAPARYLNYAKKLAENGHKELAAKVCREVIAMKHTPANQYLVGLSLSVLTGMSGEDAADDLFAHVRDDEEDVRATALVNINLLKSPVITARLLNELEDSPDPEVTVGIIRALGDRGDVATLPAVIAKFGDDNADIAATAVAASGEIDRAKALPALLEALKSDNDKATVEAIVTQLLRVKTDLLLPAVAAAIPGATAEGQVALIGVLGQRRAASQKEAVFAAAKSDNSKVRSAAYDALGRVAEASDLSRLRDMMLSAEKKAERTSARKAFVAAAGEAGDSAAAAKLLQDSFGAANEDSKVALLDALSAIADKGSLAMVMKVAGSAKSEDVQDAAVRALSEWKTADSAPMLVQIAGKSKNEKQQVLAVRGLARLATEAKDKPEQRIALLKDALRLAKRPEEQKSILSQFADIHTTESLEAISPYVDKEGVAAEAAAAAVKIAMPAKEGEPGIRGAEAAETLTRALPAIPNLEPRNAIEKHIYSIINEIEHASMPVDDEGFTVLFNGKDLSGWCGDTEGYSVENGALVCRKDGGGKLFTEKQFGDYVLRFDFKLQAGGNNGVGIRTPLHGDSAYVGMEIQILDDKDPQYKDIKDWQHHGSVYGIAPAQHEADLKIGEWNTEEIIVNGRNVKVTVNGKVVNDVNLDEAIKDGIVSNKPHPGVMRNRGHVGFLGHHHRVEFRNIRLKNIANNNAPEGFTTLFNGKNLEGWKGLVTNPIKRAKAPSEKLQKQQKKANESMNEHWDIIDGILFFDGDGSHLCTNKDYRNFEMYVDWCIPPGGDNGIYLRGSPQVQIWDTRYWPQGSGGLYNNQRNTSDPLTLADNVIGQWNTFHIKMVDDKVTVYLNDKLVVEDEILENYWDRKLPIFERGQIELQSHGSPAWWRNIYLKELPN